jgi:hypothetical protein
MTIKICFDTITVFFVVNVNSLRIKENCIEMLVTETSAT